MPRYLDIPQKPRAAYSVTWSWHLLEDSLENLRKEQEEVGYSFELNPDFQRGHVWTASQKRAYIEHKLTGGKDGSDIYFNHPGWQNHYEADMVCLDGLQRITAVRQYLNNEFTVFEGYYHKDYTDKLRDTHHTFTFHVCTLPTRIHILTFYLGFNTGGTQHSEEHINHAKNLLAVELEKVITKNKTTKYQMAYYLLNRS